MNFCAKCGALINKTASLEIPKRQDDEPNVILHDNRYKEALIKHLSDIIHCESSLIGFESAVQQNHEAIAKLNICSLLSAPPSKPFNVGSAGNKKYEQDMFAYEDEIFRYKIRLSKEELRIKKQKAEKRLYEEQTMRMDELIVHAKETLSTLYGLNLLHRKYQNFAAVASMYDYLSTGRTSSLTRYENDPGAYNIYEDDMRVGKIVDVVEMVGSQIINTIGDLSKAMQLQNQAICDAIYYASEIQKSSAAQVIDGINRLNESNHDFTETSRKNDEIRNRHLAEISRFNEIQTNALRQRTAWGQRLVLDKSGWPVG